MGDDVRSRMAEYDRRYLNIKMMILPKVDEGYRVIAPLDKGGDQHCDMSAILDDVDANDVTYVVYRDAEHNPVAVLLPWNRYSELVSTEQDHDAVLGGD